MDAARITFLILTSLPQVFAQQYRTALDMRVPWNPEAMTMNGKTTLWYELCVTNFASDSLLLEGLEVADPNETVPLLALEASGITKRSVRIGDPKALSSALPPGATCLIYLEFSLPTAKQQQSLKHSLSCRSSRQGEKFLVHGALTNVTARLPLVIGKPLGRGIWAAINEPAWPRGHRRVIYIVEGKARIPGRFAIDFIRLDEQGHYAKGDENIIQNWYGFGNEILAVADGIVSAAKDDFPESPTIDRHPSYTADKATGNYISIDLGNGRFAFYEHLKPGSIRVKTGQTVKIGDVIAALGFTGQSTGPHLHFHVADMNSPLGAEGVPFVFDEFELLGTYPDMEDFGKTLWKPVKAMKVTNERPLPYAVIRFTR